MPVRRLILATADPSNIFAIDDIKFLTGYNIEVVVASEEADQAGAIDRYYDQQATSLDDVMADFDDSDIDVVSDDDEFDVRARHERVRGRARSSSS